MAPHLGLDEQGVALSALACGKSAGQIYDLLAKRRVAKEVHMVNIIVVRRFLRGKTHKRGRVETRGRKGLLTRRGAGIFMQEDEPLAAEPFR